MGVKLLTLHLRININRMQVLRVKLVIRGKEVRVTEISAKRRVIVE